MISWINPKVIVKDAGQKGTGSFANALIAKDEVVIVQGGRMLDYKTIEASDYKAFCNHCFQIDGDVLICPIEPMREKMDGVFHVNHSCNPTCGLRGQTVLVAMRDIQAGEEITFDYAMTDAAVPGVTCAEMTCLCGAAECRQSVTGDDWKRKDLQEKYRGYFSTYVQKLIDCRRHEASADLETAYKGK